MNLGDPELELLDPTPNIHSLFIHFDRLFFWTKLTSRVVVRWSKRMFSCAGVCSYEGKHGLCDIAISEPLLKLRPRKDLIETLLHEMIHAYLFVTSRDLDRDGHGPNFKSHMYRINKSAGLNISIYHNFHEEVELYQTHWWRCNGPCQTLKPHFGIVRRSSNRPPGPSDYWWNAHQKKCRGKFIKIKEPEKAGKKKPTAKPNANITKYINNNNNKTVDNNVPQNKPKSILKDSGNVIKSSTSGIVKIDSVFSPTSKKPPLLTGNGQTISGKRNRTNSVDVVATVRNIWANKQLSPTIAKNLPSNYNIRPSSSDFNPNKHKAQTAHVDSPPPKVKKIDDYLKNTASSILKDIYGQDFKLTQSGNNKLKVVTVQADLVDCPICNIKITSDLINRHLDECLNKDLIGKLSRDEVIKINSHDIKTSQTKEDKNKMKEIVGNMPSIPAYKGKALNKIDVNVIVKNELSIDLTNNSYASVKANNDSIKSIVTKIEHEKGLRMSDNFIIPKQEKADNKFKDNLTIKSEPGTSSVEASSIEHKCPCCGNQVDKPIEQHLDECLVFFENTQIPEEGASTSFSNTTIVIYDDDDIFDETLTFNATGTKSPCPCCLRMVELTEMNDHLNECLGF